MAKAKKIDVGVVLGSDSDLPVIESALKLFDEFGLSYEVRILSAHRTPDEVARFASSAAGRGIKVIIAVAGMSAALPGVISAYTNLPVIGVPIASGILGGIDALLAISQMPPGVPVGTTAVGSAGAKNAVILAARIIGLNNKTVANRLKKFVTQQKKAVLTKDKKLNIGK